MDEQAFLTALCDAGELNDRWLSAARRHTVKATIGGDRYGMVYHARRECLLLAAECWGFGDNHRSLERRVKAEWKRRHAQEYGSVLLAFLLLTVLGAAISWAVQRLLDRWWPNHSTQELCTVQSFLKAKTRAKEGISALAGS